eukprot:m.338093 g.338093  ORF g.338093 m.338093 type:complete len:553 (-) comp18312_c0_seq1:82-1740(-)
MFYSEFVLAKKGALGKVWLAAHWEKKLTRTQASKSNIVEACNSIIKPVAPLALRTSGHLLLGVVRIFEIKQKNLMHDCNDAFVKFRNTFQPVLVDLPGRPNTSSITMVEKFSNFGDEELPDPNALDDTYVSMNTGSQEDITLPDNTLSSIDVVPPEMSGFGDAYGTMDVLPFVNVNEDDSRKDEEEQVELGRDADNTEVTKPIDDTLLDEGHKHDSNINLDVSEIPADPSMMEPNMSGFGDYEPADLSNMPSELNDTLAPARKKRRTIDDIEDLDPIEKTTKEKQSRKRKLPPVMDSSLEIANDVMRKGLDTEGPNDITRQPYKQQRGPFKYDRIAFSVTMYDWRLQDNSMEALFSRPSIPGFSGQILEKFKRHLKPTSGRRGITKEAEKDEDKIEPNAEPDQSNVELGRQEDPEVTQENFLFDEMQAPQDITLEDPGLIPDDSKIEDASGLDQTLGDSLMNNTDEDVSLIASDEHVLTVRTQKMIKSLHTTFESTDEISYNKLTKNKTRRQAATCLFELLVLKTKGYIDVDQSEPYSDILVSPTDKLVSAN